MKVLVIDDSDKLSGWWRLGSLISGADVVIRAVSWTDACLQLRDKAARVHPSVPMHLQVWGHGQAGHPLIGGQNLQIKYLATALGLLDPGDTVWFRSCDTAKGKEGHEFMRTAARVLGCRVVAHCTVISAPNPLFQGEIVGLRHDQEPWWPLDGAGLPGCSTLRMNPPSWAFRP